MKKNFTLMILLSLILISGRAQTNTGKVSGKVYGENQALISLSTVSLLFAKDSGIVKMSVSDTNGNFGFDNIREGQYLLAASAIGYNRVYSKVFEVKPNKVIETEPLLLKFQSKSLAEVTVNARRPLIEQKGDKLVVNVEASITNVGSSALEVLEKSPGVMVNSEGAISLRGKQGVNVMIDGKPTYLSSADLATMLKNMPASALDQIEIMTNPSARFDAAGNSGVINIKTKKGKANGFNGNIMLGASTSIYQLGSTVYLLPKSQNSFNFNYRKDKLNLFGSYNPNFSSGRHTMYFDRKFSEGNVLTGSSDQESRIRFSNRNHSMKLGMDWTADKKNTFGIVVSGFLFNRVETPQTVSNTRDAAGLLESTLVSHADNHAGFKNFSGNLNWKLIFDTTGKELTADFDYVRYSNVSEMLLTTDLYNSSEQHTGTLLLKGHLPSDIFIYTFKSDYVYPLKNGRIETGIKSSFVKNQNVADYTRLIADKWSSDDRSNHFVYDENINAVYISARKQVEKWTLQGGLRYENTNAKGRQVANDSTFKRNLHSLFPSAFVSYAVSKSNLLTVSYSRRINRPNYKDLNPFIYFLDSLTYAIGNPNLRPQYTHSFEVSHTYKSKFITTINYSNTKDVISQVLRQKPDEKITFVSLENVSGFRNIGLSVTAPVKLASWWNVNLWGNVFNNRYSGMYENQPIDASYTSFMFNITNSLTLGKGYSAEVSGFYQHKGFYQLTYTEPMYRMSIGAQKQVLKGKGTIRLNVRDPFAWQRFKGVTKYGGVDFTERNRPDSRQVSASFSYRFGNGQSQTRQRKNSSSQDEQNRVNVGN